MPIGNLRVLANTTTRVINPNLSATLYVSTGYTTDASHRQQPTYAKNAILGVNVQPASSGDIRHMDALNIQGVDKVAFLNGAALAIDRVVQVGGDLLVFAPGALPEGTTWLIVASLEQWSATWCKVAIKLQDDQLSL